jgi:hypothetical protein
MRKYFSCLKSDAADSTFPLDLYLEVCEAVFSTVFNCEVGRWGLDIKIYLYSSFDISFLDFSFFRMCCIFPSCFFPTFQTRLPIEFHKAYPHVSAKDTPTLPKAVRTSYHELNATDVMVRGEERKEIVFFIELFYSERFIFLFSASSSAHRFVPLLTFSRFCMRGRSC